MASTSPWIDQLKLTRPTISLDENLTTEVAVVGAGIAGVSTAYFLLKETQLAVSIVEAGKAAHGATGHNAGQIVSYFEQQLSGLTQKYGLKMAAEAQTAIESGWQLIEKIYADTKIPTPFAQFTGYAGCQNLEEVLVHLENIVLCRQANIPIEPMIIADDVPELTNVPDKYYGLYTRLPQKDVMSLLETKNTSFIAVLSARKGCMNSALFCEDLLDHLLAEYPDRFHIYEHSSVTEVRLEKDRAILKIGEHSLTSDRVVLCTNGFENFTINNTAGADLDASFHHLVKGTVGYMAAYLEDHQRSPIAISYLPKQDHGSDKEFDYSPYFYLTRRTLESSDNKQSLICVGGPEALMDDTNNYKKEHPYPAEARRLIDDFLHATYAFAPQQEMDYQYMWHGLMGYTPNGLRCIGPEPINSVLLYNLGCNGVGILPSIYGGKKISQFLNGDHFPDSIFDPEDHRHDHTQRFALKAKSLLLRIRKSIKGGSQHVS